VLDSSAGAENSYALRDASIEYSMNTVLVAASSSKEAASSSVSGLVSYLPGSCWACAVLQPVLGWSVCMCHFSADQHQLKRCDCMQTS
jgi:hypothetical protein